MALGVRGVAAGMLAVVLAIAAPVAAQVFTGRIDLAIEDATGGRLPGVTVELTGPVNQTAVTDETGEARFLNLPVGRYEVTARLAGFNDYRNTNVQVAAGAAVPLTARMAVAGTAEIVQVVGETPIVDVKKQTVATNVSLDELQNIPTARDPWVVMQTVPGIVVDRVNVGGSESGQQSNYMAKGASGTENTWNLDGIPITDMGAVGASPTYYDFDMFQEMQVTTGGADVANPTPGVQLNFVLKQGANTPHGSARIFFENESLQANNMPADLAASIGGRSGKGNRTDQYADYGFEVGGPLMRDKLWAWGSFGKTDVRIRTLTDLLDRTILENYAFKVHAQVTPSIRPSFTFFRGDKIKEGRGASATRTDPTTWNQSGPTTLYKGEANFVIGNNLFLVGRGSYADMGFSLTPRGGMNQNVYRDSGGVWHGSHWLYSTERPQTVAMADANLFRGRHEVKFGFTWRNAPVDSISQLAGNKIWADHLETFDQDRMMIANLYRDWASNTEGKYFGAYVGDTVSFDRATLNLALRWDYANSSVKESSIVAIPGLENILPGVNAAAIDDAIVYRTPSPRIGLTYALDEQRKTLLRGSYAMFASQLGATEASFVSAIQYSSIYYYAIDRNNNNTAEPSELLLDLGPIGYYGFDPENPGAAESVNRIGDYGSPRTHELIFGVDREVFTDFGVSASFTWRRYNDRVWTPLIGVRRPDYVQMGTLSGSDPPIGSYDVPLYGLPASKVPPGGGREYVTREGYYQRFWGLEFSATKRLSNRWMARLGFSTNDHREYFPDPDQSITDPTPNPCIACTGQIFQWGPLQDGGLVIRQTSGSGKSGIYMVTPRYQLSANGMWQGPWGINLGGNLLTRQGYAMPFFRSRVRVADPLAGSKTVLVAQDLDDARLPTVTTIDVRLEKAFTFGRSNVIVDFDVFNLTNTDTVLGRQFDLRLTGPTGFNRVLEIMNPRIARIGVRVNF